MHSTASHGQMGSRKSTIVGPEGDAVLEVTRDHLGDRLRTVVEYDEDDYHVLYLSEWLENHLGEEGVRETTENLHSYVHLDFVERELYADLTPAAGAVQCHITRLERATFVRFLVGDAALFLSVDPDTDLTALCDAVESTLDR